MNDMRAFYYEVKKLQKIVLLFIIIDVDTQIKIYKYSSIDRYIIILIETTKSCIYSSDSRRSKLNKNITAFFSFHDPLNHLLRRLQTSRTVKVKDCLR